MNASTPESPNQAPISPDKSAWLARFQGAVDALQRQMDLCRINMEIISSRMSENNRILSDITQEIKVEEALEALRSRV